MNKTRLIILIFALFGILIVSGEAFAQRNEMPAG